ncbi:response regulator transcription factor [Geodermatophilus sp. SYSU D00691]
MANGWLRAGDAEKLLRVLEDGWRDDPAEAMPWALLHGLQQLVPCDSGVSYQHHVPAARVTPLIQGAEDDGSRVVYRVDPCPPDEPFWQHWPGSMCSWPQRSGDLRSVIHTGDFLPTERARRADPMLQVLVGLRYSMIVSLPAAPGEVRRVIFQRESDSPFTERDRQVAALARPHLQEIWLDAEQRRRGVPRLTPREWEVLERAAAGRSFADIAAELFVSVGTVRKHMEHVRERLGVHSIAEAAAIALPRPPRHHQISRGVAQRSMPVRTSTRSSVRSSMAACTPSRPVPESLSPP